MKIIITGTRGEGKTVIGQVITRYLKSLGQNARFKDDAVHDKQTAEGTTPALVGMMYEAKNIDVVVAPTIDSEVRSGPE